MQKTPDLSGVFASVALCRLLLLSCCLFLRSGLLGCCLLRSCFLGCGLLRSCLLSCGLLRSCLLSCGLFRSCLLGCCLLRSCLLSGCLRGCRLLGRCLLRCCLFSCSLLGHRLRSCCLFRSCLFCCCLLRRCFFRCCLLRRCFLRCGLLGCSLLGSGYRALGRTSLACAASGALAFLRFHIAFTHCLECLGFDPNLFASCNAHGAVSVSFLHASVLRTMALHDDERDQIHRTCFASPPGRCVVARVFSSSAIGVGHSCVVVRAAEFCVSMMSICGCMREIK